jgi:hypothetical protein
MTKTDLPYNTAGDLGPAGDCGRLCEKLWRKQICHILLVLVTWDLLVTVGNYSKNYDENRSAIQYCWWPRTCCWLGKLFEKLWRKQICHTILLVTWDLLVTEEIIGKARPKTDLPYNTAGDMGPAICPVWRFSRFSTICAKIHMLNLIINKVTV